MSRTVDMKSVRECFVCGKELHDIGGPGRFQPAGAAICRLHGNYGSSVFDSLMDAPRDFYVCDDCLTARIPRTDGVPDAR